MEKEICPLCKGTRHVQVLKDGVPRLVRCECVIREMYEQKLERYNLSVDYLLPYITTEGITPPADKDMALIDVILKKAKEGKSAKTIFLNCVLKTDKAKRFLAFLCALSKKDQFIMEDLSNIIDMQFRNEKFSLKRITVITIYYNATKNLKAKLIKDIKLRASMENKIVIFVVDNLHELRTDCPELGNFIDDSIIAPLS